MILLTMSSFSHQDATLPIACDGSTNCPFSSSKILPGVTRSKTVSAADVVATRKLAAWDIEIDALTEDQEKYLNSWQV